MSNRREPLYTHSELLEFPRAQDTHEYIWAEKLLLLSTSRVGPCAKCITYHYRSICPMAYNLRCALFIELLYNMKSQIYFFSSLIYSLHTITASVSATTHLNPNLKALSQRRRRTRRSLVDARIGIKVQPIEKVVDLGEIKNRSSSASQRRKKPLPARENKAKRTLYICVYTELTHRTDARARVEYKTKRRATNRRSNLFPRQ